MKNLNYKLNIFEEVTNHHTPNSVIRALQVNAPFDISEQEIRLDLLNLKDGQTLRIAEDDVKITKIIG
jgi:hypothetical protein